MPEARLGLGAGFVLLVATGFTDAYTFLRHGRVFAEAMTGNLVLIGVGAFDSRIIEFWRPLLAFGAFLVGVAIAWVLAGARSSERTGGARLPVLVILVEVVVLSVVGALPASFSQAAIVAAVAFGAGLQTATFRHVGEAQLSTVVMTSNSAQAVGAVLTALASGGREDVVRARALVVALAGFIVGVFIGALTSSELHDQAAWLDALLFAIAGALYLDGQRDRGPAPA